MYRLRAILVFTTILTCQLFATDLAVPQKALSFQEKAFLFQNTGNPEGAKAEYQKLIQAYPSTIYALDSQSQIVKLHLASGQLPEAKSELSILKANYASLPEYVQKTHELGWEFVKAKDYTTALNIYVGLQTEFPNHERVVWFQRSVVQAYLEQGDLINAQKAIDQMKTAYSGHVSFVPEMIETAERLRAKKQYAMASGVYDYLVGGYSQCDEAVNVKRRQIQNMLNLEQPESADQEIDVMFTAYSKRPAFVKEAHEMAWRFVEWKRFDTALTVYNRLVEQFPNHERAVWFQRSMFQTYLAMGDRAKADAVVKTVAAEFKQHPDYYNQVGLIAQKYRSEAKAYATARELYQSLLTEFPEHEESYRVQAVISKTYMEEGNFTAADEELSTLLSKYKGPKVADEALDLVKLYRLKYKDYSRALEFYFQVLKQYPEHEKAVDIERAIAWIYIEMGAKEMANERIGKMVAAYNGNPRLPLLLNELGYAYRTRGHFADSIQTHQVALKYNPDPKEIVAAYAGVAKSLIPFQQIADPNQAQTLLAEGLSPEAIADKLVTDYVSAPGTGVHVFQIGEEYYFLGERLAKAGNKQQSNEAFLKAINIWGHSRQVPDLHHAAMATYFSGIASGYLGDDASALSYFQQVATLYPSYEKVWHAKFMIAEYAGKQAAAGKLNATDAVSIQLAAYQDILTNDPNCPVDSIVRHKLESLSK